VQVARMLSLTLTAFSVCGLASFDHNNLLSHYVSDVLEDQELREAPSHPKTHERINP
jgi:hypothetical protein